MPERSTIRPYFSILLVPALVSVGTGGVWWLLFFPYHWNVGKADETALTNTLIPVLATFHAILAAAVLSKVWEEFKTIRRCVQAGDEAAYRRCLQDRIPPAIHLLLAVMSILIVAGTMLIHYDNAIAGFLVVGAITFVLTLYWEVATNLDNPQCGAWYVNEIPLSWRQVSATTPEPPPPPAGSVRSTPSAPRDASPP